MLQAKRGGLKDTPVDDMLSTVMNAVLQRTGVEPEVSADSTLLLCCLSLLHIEDLDSTLVKLEILNVLLFANLSARINFRAFFTSAAFWATYMAVNIGCDACEGNYF